MRRSTEIKLRRFWYAHRWHLVAAIVALPVLAVMVQSALGGSDPRAQMPSRAEVCAATDQATSRIAARYPDVPKESLDELQEQMCTQDPAPAPVGEDAAIPASPGCHMLPDTDRRSPAQVSATEPAEAVPFFAPRSGRLPATGSPRVGGVQLPAGSRCGPFWSTDAGVPDAIELASKLAKAFPSTGLWPVLWPGTEPDTDIFGGGSRALARLGSLDAETILRRAWRAGDYYDGPFPGLAKAEPAAERLKVEPFGDVLEGSLDQPPGGSIVMLVPANRPADVLAVLEQQTTMYFNDAEMTAVLRSWEERFGAVVASLGSGTVDLVVGAPPGGDQLDRLAAEHLVFTPDQGPIADHHRVLGSDGPTADGTYKRYWMLGWPD